MKSFKTIKIKLVILYLVLVFLVMVVSSTFILISYRANEANKAQEGLISYAKNIREQVIEENDESYFQEEIGITDQGEGVGRTTYNEHQVAILSSDGSRVVASDFLLESTSLPVIISAVNDIPQYQAWRKDNDQGDFYREWFEYATSTGDYIIYVRTDASESTSALISMSRTLMFALAIALVLTAVVGLFFAKTMTAPIVAIKDKSVDIASGKLDEELIVYSDDEIGQLTESFNKMSRELKFNIDSISTEKNKLEIILHNMNDGVLAYDNTGELLHANSAASELLSMDVNLLSYGDFIEKFNIVLDENYPDDEATLLIEEKFISLNIKKYSNFYSKSNGTIIVLQDITKHKKLDNMRKDFVANVSHEIRTPLTTIKSYTETLIDGGIEDKSISENFLNVINGEVDRMTVLVKDLLDLSKFDNNKMDLTMEKINLVDIINYTINQNKILIDNKNQKVTFHNQSDMEYNFEGDKDRINQVFNNIISNSIKYSQENATINITIDTDEKNYIIYIRDNGIGIPKEDLKLIFERFYRVDKARSREMGGTGLGLAITKEIIEAHGGRIKAQSSIGQGTTMIIRFPKKR